MVIKRRFWALILILMCAAAVPALAAQDQPKQVDAQFNFCTISMSSGQGDNGAVNGIKARIEAVVYQGLSLGIEYTTASTGGMTLANMSASNAGYQDTQFQLKIPFNYLELAKAQNAGVAAPVVSPWRGMIAYKTTHLSGDVVMAGLPQTIDRINASGPGLGVELVTPVDKVSFWGLLAVYPRMSAHNVANPVANIDYYYTSVEYRAGIKIPLSQNVAANLGYYGEQQSYNGFSWTFSSLVAGIDLQF